MTNKNMLILVVFWVAITGTLVVKAQNSSIESADAKSGRQTVSFEFNTDFKEALKIEAFLGFSASFAQGSYIDYQRSFHGVSETESVVSGSIQPILFGTIGVQARYQLFKEGDLSPLQLSIGLQYHQKGFKNKFESTYTSPSNYTDFTQYEETYKLDYLSIPIQARWGNKFFGALGFSLDYYVSGTKSQNLTREQSGQGAVNGGFSGDLNQKSKLSTSEINGSSTGFVLGGGVQFTKSALLLQANFSGKTFKNLPANFSNITLQLIFSKTF
jgi:Outer membrane protein beta-barrel domain